MPEPPDRESWEQQREDFAARLIDLLEDSDAVVFFGDEAVIGTPFWGQLEC